jgi:hypothetical protein
MQQAQTGSRPSHHASSQEARQRTESQRDKQQDSERASRAANYPDTQTTSQPPIAREVSKTAKLANKANQTDLKPSQQSQTAKKGSQL